MAKKYIDQALVIKMAKPYWQTDEDGFGVEWLFDKEPIIFKRDVEVIPAADVVEVRHGRWIVITEFSDCLYAQCDQCKIQQVFYYSKPLTNYCPNCGAKMDEEYKRK